MHGYCWRRRRRCAKIGRSPKPVMISTIPLVEWINPSPPSGGDPIYLDLVELEALRLVDLEKLTLEKAGERMGVSRNTIWRLVQSGREKLIRAIFEGRKIIIQKD